MPSHSDVVIAEVGAAAALAGLVLVFLGVLVTSFQTLLGRVSDDVLSRFRRASWFAVAAFFLATASLLVSTSWLAAGGGHSFYVATLVLFFLAVGSLIVVTLYSTTRVLLR